MPSNLNRNLNPDLNLVRKWDGEIKIKIKSRTQSPAPRSLPVLWRDSAWQPRVLIRTASRRAGSPVINTPLRRMGVVIRIRIGPVKVAWPQILLTPTLFRGERENCRQSVGESVGSGSSGDCRRLLPLPSGEGRGEGNLGPGSFQNVTLYPDAQVLKRAVNQTSVPLVRKAVQRSLIFCPSLRLRSKTTSRPQLDPSL